MFSTQLHKKTTNHNAQLYLSFSYGAAYAPFVMPVLRPVSHASPVCNLRDGTSVV